MQFTTRTLLLAMAFVAIVLGVQALLLAALQSPWGAPWTWLGYSLCVLSPAWAPVAVLTFAMGRREFNRKTLAIVVATEIGTLALSVLSMVCRFNGAG